MSAYLLLTVVVSLTLFWRFPNNVTHPNFYGEDGSVYLQNVVDKGWIGGSLTPFNGYSIVGLYGLEGIGWIGNEVFGSSDLLTLPMWFALVSIVFMAAVIALPYLLFRSSLGRLKTLLVVAFSALLPLPLSPHIVIGTVGNQKWVFFYLATLLVLYRLLNYKKLSLSKLVAIDLTLLVCAYTNSTTYILIPLLFVPYLKAVWDKRRKLPLLSGVWQQLRQRELLSLVLLSALLLPQVIYIALHGIPAQPGYLDAPYQASKTIEVFINRTFLFGVTHLFNGYLNDVLAVLLFVFLAGVGWFKVQGKEKVIFFVSLYAAFMASVLFVLNRRGVTDFFFGYQASGSGPDQFFFAQTLIMYLPIVLAVVAFDRWLGWKKFGGPLLVLFVLFVVASGLVSNVLYGERWRTASVFENYAQTFIDQAIVACDTQRDPITHIVVYPYPDGRFALNAPRSLVCVPQLAQYQPSYDDLKLVPHDNDFLRVHYRGDFSQTFKANQAGLDGIRLFVSTFNNHRRHGTYQLKLYDSQCRKELRSIKLPTILLDNTYYNARFAPLADSKDQTYCFTLAPPAGLFDPIAVQRSQADAYGAGVLKENGRAQTTDIVFLPLYTQAKP